MRSYIKLYGPPLLKAVKALSKIAIEIPDVCIMDPAIAAQSFEDPSDIYDHFASMDVTIEQERCVNIISKSKEMLKDYDFFFEWNIKPEPNEIYELMEKIDEALAPIGCRYTITTKK